MYYYLILDYIIGLVLLMYGGKLYQRKWKNKKYETIHIIIIRFFGLIFLLFGTIIAYNMF